MKYLLGRKGDVVGLFDPSMDPLEKTVVAEIEAALAMPVPSDGAKEEL